MSVLMQTQYGKKVHLRIVAACQPIAAAVEECRGRDGDWYGTLLITLAGELMLNGKELLGGERDHNPSRSAWAARNIMELYFWIRYVAESLENARRFHEDMLCDFQDMLKKMENEPAFSKHVEEGSKALRTAMEAVETVQAQDRFLPVAMMSKRYGEEDEYKLANKFLSKFVHPTSLGMQLRTTPVFNPVIHPSIVELGLLYVERAGPIMANALNKYVNTVQGLPDGLEDAKAGR